MMLYDYQKRIIDLFWINNAGLLCLDTGLGKSVVIIKTIQKRNRKRILYVSNKTSLYSFYKEIMKWDNGGVNFIYDKNINNDFKWLLTTYNSYDKINKIIDLYKFDCIVLDEIHNLRNKNTQKYFEWYNIIKKLKQNNNISIFGLTATPIVNRENDMKNIGELIKGDDKDIDKFLKLITIYKNKFDVAKSDNIKFPIINYNFIVKELNPIQEELLMKYNTLNRSQATFYTKEKQIAISEKLFVENSTFDDRINHILNIIKEKKNEKIIIYSQYRKTLKLLAQKLNVDYFYIDGTKSLKTRQKTIDMFLNSENTNLLLITLKTGGESINLPTIKNVILMDLWWTYSSLVQAINRVHRLNSTNEKIDVYIFSCNRTIEIKNLEIILNKYKISNEIKKYHNKVFG